jgi:hypothetical protein
MPRIEEGKQETRRLIVPVAGIASPENGYSKSGSESVIESLEEPLAKSAEPHRVSGDPVFRP